MIIRLTMALFAVALSLPVLLLGCSKPGIAESSSNLVPEAVIPSIDAVAPSKVETATFALG